MQAEVAAFSPVFAPADPSLSAANFLIFCGTVEGRMGDVTTTFAAWNTVVGERQALVKELKGTATRVVAYLKSSAAFAKRLKLATAAANKLRGIKPRRPKAPEPEPGAPVKKARNAGDQSYADIAQHFKALMESVTGLPGYAPVPVGNPITLSNLSGTLSAYRSKNGVIDTLTVAYRDALRERIAVFDGAGGLKAKMLAVKNGVKAQYGQSSAEYGVVKGIKV